MTVAHTNRSATLLIYANLWSLVWACIAASARQVMLAAGGTKQMEKEKKSKKKDPNAPKKAMTAMTAFYFFSASLRPKLTEEGKSMTEIAIECGKLWKELSEEERKKLKAEAKKKARSAHSGRQHPTDIQGKLGKVWRALGNLGALEQ